MTYLLAVSTLLALLWETHEFLGCNSTFRN
jgi:hypothetical protein